MNDGRDEMKLGAIFALASPLLLLFWFLYLLLFPAYSDYRPRAETSEWVIAPSGIMQKMMYGEIQEDDSPREVNLEVDVSTLKEIRYVRHAEISGDGGIIFQGGRDGQAVMLYPEFDDGEMSWHCLGGSAWAMPGECRNGGRLRVR